MTSTSVKEQECRDTVSPNDKSPPPMAPSSARRDRPVNEGDRLEEVGKIETLNSAVLVDMLM